MKKIAVSAEALEQALQALSGTGYRIRELQALRNGPFSGENPINKLVDEYNAALQRPEDTGLVAECRQAEEVLVAWRYRFRNARGGWGNWLLHDGPDKPVNVAFDAIELWPLYARSASIEERINPLTSGD